MQVFLTGATGYIGSAVLDAMLKGGHRVTVLARDPEKAERLRAKGATPIIGELGLPKTYVEAVKSADAVVHTALESLPRGIAKDKEALDIMLGALEQASAADSKSRVFIYTSSVWILGRTPKAAEEDATLDPLPYSEWRQAHEAQVLAASSGALRTVVVRPGIVYGGSRGIVSDLIKDALNGLIRVVGPGKNRWSCIYRQDLGVLYLRILETPAASGIVHATDEADERVMDIAEAIAAQVPQRPDIRNVPIAEAKKKMGAYAEALALDQKVRSTKARAMGWEPTQTGVITSVARLVEEFRNAERERNS